MDEDETTAWPDSDGSKSPDPDWSGGPVAPSSADPDPSPALSEPSYSVPDPLASPGQPSASASPGDALLSTSDVDEGSGSALLEAVAQINDHLTVMTWAMGVLIMALIVTMFAVLKGR